MSLVPGVLTGVRFENGYEDVPHYAKLETRYGHYGFLAIEFADQNGNNPFVSLVGFAVSGWQRGTDEIGDTLEPITDFDALPEATRTEGRVLKGVGPRLYNSRQGLGGTTEDPSLIGVYMVRIDRDRILNLRFAQGPNNILGQADRIARQFKLQRMAAKSGLGAAVSQVHYEQDQDIRCRMPAAVVHHQAPAALRRQRQRGYDRGPIPQAFMVLRDPEVYSRRIGSYAAPTATLTD